MMDDQNDLDRIPHLMLVEDSEITADVDISAIGLDEVFRPIYLFSSDGEAEIALTLPDAKRLYEWLDGAIIYLEERMQ